MNDQTMLLRQVHPNFIQDDEVSSQAFFPFPKDQGQLSVYDGDQVTPEDSFQHYTVNLELPAVGVWGVRCEEVASVGLESRSDPLPGFPAHACVDFGDRDMKACRKLAKELKKFARSRGSLHLL